MILSRFNKLALFTALALALSLLTLPSEAATRRSVTMSPVPTSLVAGQQVTLSGKTTGSLKGSKVKIQFYVGKKWKTLNTVKSEKKTGKWTAVVSVPKTIKKVSIRAVSSGKRTKIQKSAIIAPLNLVATGPGSRILGVDLSRWQSSENDIDFIRMAKGGVAFVFVKGSDGLASQDDLAAQYAKRWSPAAKTAGILVGYYHFARIPTTTSPKQIVASAKLQAKQAAARLADLGGYDDRTLPYALDIEQGDPSVSTELVTLWTFTWLEAMQKATNRAPIIYSYRIFISTRFLQDPVSIEKFRNYHLWLSQPGNPADPLVQVGQGLNGNPCFESAWKQTDCTYVWTFWQYTNRGDRETFGIPWSPSSGDCPADVTLCFPGHGTGRKHLDLDVFNGTAADLTALVNGKWLRSTAEYH